MWSWKLSPPPDLAPLLDRLDQIQATLDLIRARQDQLASALERAGVPLPPLILPARPRPRTTPPRKRTDADVTVWSRERRLEAQEQAQMQAGHAPADLGTATATAQPTETSPLPQTPPSSPS